MSSIVPTLCWSNSLIFYSNSKLWRTCIGSRNFTLHIIVWFIFNFRV